MNQKMRALILDALRSRKGDDLERARREFDGTDLDEEYGASGCTKRQILTQYEEDRRQVNEAIAFVMNL